MHPLRNSIMKRFNLLVIGTALFFNSCSQSDKMESTADAAVAEVGAEYLDSPSPVMASKAVEGSAADVVTMQTPEAINPVVNKKIVRTGNISIESKDVKASKKTLDGLLKNVQGYYENETVNNARAYTSFDLVVRIPSNKLDALLANLENGTDKITEKNLRAEDVSAQYYDTESRLKSKRAYLERYQQMVSSAKSVKDLLEIQEQIRMLQEEIDASEGVLRSLSGQVNYSTLTIHLFEENANLPMGSNSFWTRVKDSFAFGWDLIENLTIGIIGLWPLLIVAVLVIYVIRSIRRRKRSNKMDNNLHG
ncbi:DUF4349 domain-containing protein [Sphingobacterium sp. DK4209]|uniref:DUF4349 domain-containing protein n=2 Tax=Sphingobacterium zhuxiongii TaxID=2662364 RepID=A0A5Q0Q6A1_9SPHI|nr:DUF4349 domain-containing protein [Sphingobacterium sp. DK4209]QGA24993.1 DUF4349 domain-containing protein [Sphingobacterium sp. dk4302]